MIMQTHVILLQIQQNFLVLWRLIKVGKVVTGGVQLLQHVIV